MVRPRIRRLISAALGPGTIDESELLVRLNRGARPGTMFEVGAHTGDSSLLTFASRGWQIHAFEPDPSNRAALQARTSQFSNVIVVPKAVGDQAGTATLFTSTESTGISSLTSFTEGHVASVQVEVVTSTQYIEDNGVASVDVLKVDVEGYEKFVIDGFPWATHHPRAVLLEFEDRKTLPLGYSWRDLASRLTQLGYKVLVSEWHPITRYGVQHRWRRYAAYPTELEDDMAWGNLVAVDPADFRRLLRLANRQERRFAARRITDSLRSTVARRGRPD